MAGILKIYFIGAMFSLLVALFGLVDSVGGLMYPQGSALADDSRADKHAPVSPSQTANAAMTKRVGSR